MTASDELFDNYVELVNKVSDLEAQVRKLEQRNTQLHRANKFGVTFTYANGDKETMQAFSTTRGVKSIKTGERPVKMELNFTKEELELWVESCHYATYFENNPKCKKEAYED